MTRWECSAAFLFLTGPTLFAQQSSREESEYKLYSGTELVVLGVGVQDSHGKNVSGLSAKDFKVYENGQLQPIKQFPAENVR